MDILELYKKIKNVYDVENIERAGSNQTYIGVPKDRAISLITYLKQVESYSHLSFLTAVDKIESGDFELLYMLHNYQNNHDLAVVVKIKRDNASMESIHHLWAAGETYQRELREMFGIDFPGSPGLMDNFCLEGWEDIPPMRRDFNTKEYSEKTFYDRPGRKTYDPTEYMKEKLYPSEAETW